MTIDSNSSQPSSNNSNPEITSSPVSPDNSQLLMADFDSASDNNLTPEELANQEALAAIASLQSPQHTAALQAARSQIRQRTVNNLTLQPPPLILVFAAIAITIFGLALDNFVIGSLGTFLALLLSLAVLLPWAQTVVTEWFSPQERSIFVAFLAAIVAVIGLCKFTGLYRYILNLASQINWNAFGTLAEWTGAVGQILIAIIAVYVAWRQYIISKDLTIQQNLLTVQQNLITQQQTIDTYFQGISDLVLDEEGLLEDWPQERAIAAGRTAAILSSVDGGGKAKIIRFLSRSNLLSPLRRDARLGRAILNGKGSYAEDRIAGVRVIDLGVMLAGADLSGTDLRWTDVSEANLIRANLSRCDLVKANLSRTILYAAQLASADFKGTRLFYGSAQSASPRSRTEPPNYKTGEHTGAVIENADFTDAQRMSESLRYYCCTWGGEKTRATIPGGCEGISNKLN